jgi:signal transduction histidine kinase
MIYHDLRSPLTVISGSVQVLLRRLEAPRERPSLELIARSVRRMNRLIGDLLDFSAAAGGTLPIERKPGDLAALVRKSVDQLLEGNRDARIRFEAEPGEFVAAVDSRRMASAMSHLLEFMTQLEGVTGVDVTLQRLGPLLEATFSSSGGGVPDEALPYLFEPFGREEGKLGPTGWGLFVVRQIMEAHDASVEARSFPIGTRITVRMPSLEAASAAEELHS